MLSTRDIKRKIRSVRNIQQICRAMKTVSSIKLRKAEDRILAARPYAAALREITSRLREVDYSHPLLDVHDEVLTTGVVAISADKGLAGSYNTTIIRETLATVREYQAEVITIGRKVTEAMRRQQFTVESALSPLGNTPDFRVIAALADHIGELYATHRWDRVFLVYTPFGERITRQQLLPIVTPEEEEVSGEFIYEPNPPAVLDLLLPRYLRTQLYTAVLSANAAEHAERVAAMSLATENADELINSLTMQYNKSRQATITSELSDIVGAAEALR